MPVLPNLVSSYRPCDDAAIALPDCRYRWQRRGGRRAGSRILLWSLFHAGPSWRRVSAAARPAFEIPASAEVVCRRVSRNVVGENLSERQCSGRWPCPSNAAARLISWPVPGALNRQAVLGGPKERSAANRLESPLNALLGEERARTRFLSPLTVKRHRPAKAVRCLQRLTCLSSVVMTGQSRVCLKQRVPHCNFCGCPTPNCLGVLPG